MTLKRYFQTILSILLLISMMIGAFGLSGCADSQGREQKETSSLEITDDKSSQSITVDDHFLPVSDSMVSLETDDVRVDISVGNGVTIESIYDKVLSHDYLVNGVSLFKYTIFTDLDSLSLSAWKSEGIALSKNSVKPIEVLVNENRNALQLEAVSKNNDLAFHIEIFLPIP